MFQSLAGTGLIHALRSVLRCNARGIKEEKEMKRRKRGEEKEANYLQNPSLHHLGRNENLHSLMRNEESCLGRDSEVVEEQEIFVDCLCRSRGGNNSLLVEERKLNFDNEE